MPNVRWLCPCCCSNEGTPYSLPATADTRCVECAAPVTSDDIEAVAFGPGAAVVIPMPFESSAEPSRVEEALQQLREDVGRIGVLLAQLKLVLATPPKPAVSMAEATELLGCGRSQVFKLLAQGKLRRGQRVGRQVTVTIASIQALQESLIAGKPTRRRRHAGPIGPTNGASILALPLPSSSGGR